MQLDKTHVIIRARSLAEICDLSLLVLRRYLFPFMFLFALGALPFALLNYWLLGEIVFEAELEGIVDSDTTAARAQYLWLMISLVFLQLPLSSVFAINYIGQAIFEKRPPIWQVGRDVCKLAPRWLLSLGLLRLAIPAVLLLLAKESVDFDFAIEGFCLGLCVLVALCVRAFRPHATEILMLERCPIRAGKTNMLSAGKRSALFHAPLSSDSFGRFIGVSLGVITLSLAFFYFFQFVRGVFVQRWNYSIFVQLFLVPLSMWLAAALSVVIHFLNYLDGRIRLEGWDVELKMRAEAIRLFDGQAEASGALKQEGAAT